MIVASHQPNFMPYMGFFYKMYMCDIFTLSDGVMFSKQGFHNYNFFNESGQRKKITVPVSIKNEEAISEAMLSEWNHNKVKLAKRIEGYYSKTPYFKEIYPHFQPVLTGSYESLTDFNIDLLIVFRRLFGLYCPLVKESSLELSGKSPTEQIAEICKKTNANKYLSGEGAKSYLCEGYLADQNIQVLWSNYKPLEYGSVPNASAFDYLMYCGAKIPDEWKYEREKLHNGKNL